MRRTDFTHAQNVINSAAVLDIWRGFFQGFDSASLALRLIDRLVLGLNLAYGNGVEEFRISEKLIDLMDSSIQYERELIPDGETLTRREGNFSRLLQVRRELRLLLTRGNYPDS